MRSDGETAVLCPLKGKCSISNTFPVFPKELERWRFIRYQLKIRQLFASLSIFSLTDLFFFDLGEMENESPQGFRNSESWALKSGIQLKGSGIPLTIGTGVQIPLTTNPESKSVLDQMTLTTNKKTKIMSR